MSETTPTLEQRMDALHNDVMNLISVLLHNEIIHIIKNEDGTASYKLNEKNG